MQRKLYIVFITAACVLSVVPKAFAEFPPLQQCVGSKSVFAVSGDSASTFRYSITGGEFLDTAKADSLVVQWGMQNGAYRVGVREVAFGGCESEWVYIDVELIGSPLRFDETEFTICPSDTLYLPLNTALYKTIRWSDPDVPAHGISKPGNYRIWVEDSVGCWFNESITIIACEPRDKN